MQKIIKTLIFILGCTALSAFAESYIDTENNQIVLKSDSIIQYKITSWGNTSPLGMEDTCPNYQKKNPNKNCISYQVIIPNYNDKFGIFVKTESSSQDLIGKTIFKYDFAKRKIVNVSEFLPKDLQNTQNFWMWYSNRQIVYTSWDWTRQAYNVPNSFSPTVFE